MSTEFDLDVWAAEARREPFTFTLGCRKFSMPVAGELDKSLLKSVNLSAPSPEDIEKLLKAGLADQWEDFDALPAPLSAIGELFRRWQKHEGAPLGESVASADS
ncbi:hypothetical protein H8N00_02670 [Streptomyces sp. AC563]|uniref:hypothetical protein n=1 Tax=Streptomyces buecherae TaxID=2763006 RepID=UPI00164DEFE8|nr:hypothetical protein [Streptomyces buecherae]MBC3987828.1 hypothetical protein [Streptomyces buecherae]